MSSDARWIGSDDPTTAPFWEGTRSGVLLIQRCRDCGRHQFYPRPFCLSCASDSVEWIQAAGTGTVYSRTTVHRAPPGATVDAPFVVAIVELDEGPRMLTALAGGPSRIGDRVTVRWRTRAEGPPVPVFAPLAESGCPG